ncbi:MAG: hypothetical protein IKI45_09085 [Oscillospiraceae bacterium]|nr:hypothetical protein [Oscillospiraceae bacterium]
MKFRQLAAVMAACSLAAFLSGCGNQPSAAEDSAVSSSTAEASAESSEQPDADSQPEIGSDLTIGAASVTAHAGDKAVPVNVQVWNNPGYSACGIQLFYDTKLKPVTEKSDNEFSDSPGGKCDLGKAAEGFMTSCLVNEEDHLIAFGALSGENNTEDGTIFTVYFDVPEDAPSGQTFTFVTVIDSFNDETKTSLNPKTINGTLTIE